MFKNIFVLESTWDRNKPLSNVSVMPMLSEFAKQRELKVFHQTFTDSNSFKHWIIEFNKHSNGDSLLYIASHGNPASLEALHGIIKRTTIIDILKKSKNIHYVHFGTCLFGNDVTLNLIMKKIKHLKWVAGYKKSIDWVDSFIFDIFFWSRICPSGRIEKNKHKKTHTIVDNIINKEFKPLAFETGFNFYYKNGKLIYYLEIDK